MLDLANHKIELTDNDRRDLIRRGQYKRANQDLKIPRRFVGKRLDDLDGWETQKERLRDAINANRSVYLFGPCGTGKTHAAVGALLETYAARTNFSGIHGEQIRARFLGATDFFLELKDGISKGWSEVDTLKDIVGLDLLVFDDFAGVRITDYVQSMTAALVDKLYNHTKPTTVFTSNFNLDQIATIIDDRTASRLAEMAVVIEITGPDRRLGGEHVDRQVQECP